MLWDNLFDRGLCVSLLGLLDVFVSDYGADPMCAQVQGVDFMQFLGWWLLKLSNCWVYMGLW